MIAIVTTCYNVAPWIWKSATSALMQDIDGIRLYLVEDKSTDGTLQICRNIQDAYGSGRVRLIENPENVGAGMGRRIGIGAALEDGADWILTLDGDDWLEKDYIRSLWERAEATGADIVAGGVFVHTDEKEHDGSYKAFCYGSSVHEGAERVTYHWGNEIIFLNNKLVRASLYKDVPYCTRRYVEDTPVVVKLHFLARKVAFAPVVGYHYRLNPGSLTHTVTPLKDALYKALCLLDLMDFFESQGEDGKYFLENLPLAGQLSTELSTIKATATNESIAPYLEDWQDFTLRLIKRMV